MEQLQLSLPAAVPAKARRQKKRRRAAAKPKDAGFSDAMQAARDILQWRLGPNPPDYRLAEALSGR